MNWNSHMEATCYPAIYPYYTTGSFIEYFEGFIFDSNFYTQNSYKFGTISSGNTYYDYIHPHQVHDHFLLVEEYGRHANCDPIYTQWQSSENFEARASLTEICPNRHHNSGDFEVIWEDNIDPDAMTYEELLELGETVGTQSRGLSHELISLLPVSKYKRSFFLRKKSRKERCVICQLEYKRGDRRITLPCNHIYHATCVTKWLHINKACPICFAEVFGGGYSH